jgi:hypothetical protein
MTPACETCRHSIGVDAMTAQALLQDHHARGTGKFTNGLGLVCERRRIVGPVPCSSYQREVGSDEA